MLGDSRMEGHTSGGNEQTVGRARSVRCMRRGRMGDELASAVDYVSGLGLGGGSGRIWGLDIGHGE